MIYELKRESNALLISNEQPHSGRLSSCGASKELKSFIFAVPNLEERQIAMLDKTRLPHGE